MGDWRPGSTGKHDAASPAAAATGPLLPRANSDGSEANQGKNDYASGVVCPAPVLVVLLAKLRTATKL